MSSLSRAYSIVKRFFSRNPTHYGNKKGRHNWSEYSIAGDAHELHHVRTHDDITIGLWRYTAEQNLQSHSEPVLLVHGLGANHRNLTIDEEHGLAQYLNRHGYDCWAVDLRGRGASESPDTPWDFDDYAKLDLPAVIEYILAVSDSEKLHWVGHSMGGMLYYVLAGALEYDEKIASGTTIASPVDFPRPGFLEQIGELLHEFPLDLELPSPRGIVGLLEKGLDFLPPSFMTYLYNPRNMSRKKLLKAARLIPAGTSSNVLTQFPKWFIENQWMDQSNRIDYREGVKSITVPSLVISGSIDRLTPPELIKSGFDDLATDDKRFVLAGKISGYRRNYSHIDLVFGREAPTEIFPQIADWIKSHPIDKPVTSGEDDDQATA